MQKQPSAGRALAWAMAIGLMSSATWAGPTAPVIDVYKSPTCGCCVKWIEHLKSNGFTVRSHDTLDVTQHKQRLGVPAGYGACHTAVVNGYVIEGHVPARDIKRLLREKPLARGLAVPGMPVGSPGMEQGNHMEPYEVILLDKRGAARTFTSY
ncbi:MAG: DUF411 domain-containing protein [Pseudomonadota bacterium]|jgi:hypothetical protein